MNFKDKVGTFRVISSFTIRRKKEFLSNWGIVGGKFK